MNTEEITSFVKVAKLQHMTNAAAELNISQSALSSSIKKLELELGVRLFERRGRHIELNTYGEIFLRYAENMLLSLSQLEQELAEAKSAEENQVSIAMPPLYSFAGLQARLRESCPDVSVRITHTRIKELPGALLSGEVDFCIRAARVDDPRLSCRELTDDRLIMIVPPTHPLAGREQVHLSAFRNDTFVNFSRSSGEAPNVTDLEFYCRQIGFEPRIVLWSPNMREILESVRNGVGAAMVPLRVLSGYSVEDLCCLQISEPDCWTHLRLYALKNVREMPAVKRVRRCIEAYFDAEK